MINQGTRYQKLYTREISKTFSIRTDNAISIWFLPYRCCSYHANRARQLVSSRKLQSVCQTELFKNWPRHGKLNWVTKPRTFLIVKRWNFGHHFQYESLLCSLTKYFCELFPEKIFNFHKLSGLDYFRKWAVTGHDIGDLEVSVHGRHRGGGSTSL